MVAAIPSTWNKARENVLSAGPLLEANRTRYWRYCRVITSRRISSRARIESLTASAMSGNDSARAFRFISQGTRDCPIASFDSAESGVMLSDNRQAIRTGAGLSGIQVR